MLPDKRPREKGRRGKEIDSERGWMQRESRGGRERPAAHTRQGVILTRGAHSLITGFGLRSAGVRPDPNPQ